MGDCQEAGPRWNFRRRAIVWLLIAADAPEGPGGSRSRHRRVSNRLDFHRRIRDCNNRRKGSYGPLGQLAWCSEPIVHRAVVVLNFPSVIRRWDYAYRRNSSDRWRGDARQHLTQLGWFSGGHLLLNLGRHRHRLFSTAGDFGRHHSFTTYLEGPLPLFHNRV